MKDIAMKIKMFFKDILSYFGFAVALLAYLLICVCAWISGANKKDLGEDEQF